MGVKFTCSKLVTKNKPKTFLAGDASQQADFTSAEFSWRLNAGRHIHCNTDQNNKKNKITKSWEFED